MTTGQVVRGLLIRTDVCFAPSSCIASLPPYLAQSSLSQAAVLEIPTPGKTWSINGCIRIFCSKSSCHSLMLLGLKKKNLWSWWVKLSIFLECAGDLGDLSGHSVATQGTSSLSKLVGSWNVARRPEEH